MKTTSKFGFVLIGLLVGIVAAQALPLLAHGTVGSTMGHGAMHGMGGDHMKAMHSMMGPDGNCPMGDSAEMFEACQAMLADDPALLEQCETLMGSGEHSPDDCPMLTGNGAQDGQVLIVGVK